MPSDVKYILRQHWKQYPAYKGWVWEGSKCYWMKKHIHPFHIHPWLHPLYMILLSCKWCKTLLSYFVLLQITGCVKATYMGLKRKCCNLMAYNAVT